MAIENVGLMHRCFTKHSCIGTEGRWTEQKEEHKRRKDTKEGR